MKLRIIVSGILARSNDNEFTWKGGNGVKQYMEPSMEVQIFAIEDVITTSGGIGGGADVGSGGEIEW